MNYHDVLNLREITKVIPELFIKTFLSIVGLYFSFYKYIDDYSEIKEVKYLIALTSLLLLNILLIRLSEKNKQKILKEILPFSIIFSGYQFWMVYKRMLDLHKDFNAFLLNYALFFFFSIASIYAIKVLFKILQKNIENSHA